MSDTVLVAIPYWGAAAYIEQAVESALAQSYPDVRVLVCGDGEEPPVAIRDERLTVLAFERNIGAPATQQAMLLATPYRWYAPMGADDWLEPDYVAGLALGARANASGALWHDCDGGQTLVRDHCHTEFGVFEAELLRSIGGYGADCRCGQDTLLYEQLLPNVAAVSYAETPRYHKRIRAGSLTAAPATGFGSSYRTEVVWHNRDVAEHCLRVIGWRDLEAIRHYRAALVPPVIAAEVAFRAERIAEALA